jgi:hypothetical protein
MTKIIFNNLPSSIPIDLKEPQYSEINEQVAKTIFQITYLNQSGDLEKIREILSTIFAESLDASSTIFPPFHTNFGHQKGLTPTQVSLV